MRKWAHRKTRWVNRKTRDAIYKIRFCNTMPFFLKATYIQSRVESHQNATGGKKKAINSEFCD